MSHDTLSLSISVPELLEHFRTCGDKPFSVVVRSGSALFEVTADRHITHIQQRKARTDAPVAFGLLFEPRTADFLTSPYQFLSTIEEAL